MGSKTILAKTFCSILFSEGATSASLKRINAEWFKQLQDYYLGNLDYDNLDFYISDFDEDFEIIRNKQALSSDFINIFEFQVNEKKVETTIPIFYIPVQGTLLLHNTSYKSQHKSLSKISKSFPANTLLVYFLEEGEVKVLSYLSIKEYQSKNCLSSISLRLYEIEKVNRQLVATPILSYGKNIEDKVWWYTCDATIFDLYYNGENK